jgi:hypothetical protein
VPGHQFVEFALLQQLGHRADRKTQGGHGGTQLEGLLNHLGSPQFVIAQADAKSAGLARATAPLATAPLAIATAAVATVSIATASLATVDCASIASKPSLLALLGLGG